MKIIFTKKTLKDTFYSVTPINWLLQKTALSNIYRKETKLEECSSVTKNIIYAFFFGLLNTFCLFYKMKSFIGNRQTGLVKFSDVVQMTYWLSYLEYIIDIYFVYNYGRDLFLKYFETFNHIDAMLSFTSYDNIRNIIVNTIVFSIALFLFSSIFDFVAWALVEGFVRSAVYSVEYLYFFLNMLTILDITSHVIQVEHRLKMIRSSLLDFRSRSINSIKDNEPLYSLETSSGDLKTKIIPECYLLLVDQVEYINTSYGGRVLVHCVFFLINMIHIFNSAIRIMAGTMALTTEDNTVIPASLLDICLPAMAGVLRAIIYEVIIIILIYRCERTYRQSDGILNIIDKLLAGNNCGDMKTNLLEFRNLLITRPIKFHAANFFNIDYVLFVTLNSVVVTYTIIMLQSMQ